VTAKYEGYFRNGDQWTGADSIDDGQRWFLAVATDGSMYETQEMPTRYPLLTMIRVQDGISANEANRQITLLRAQS